MRNTRLTKEEMCSFLDKEDKKWNDLTSEEQEAKRQELADYEDRIDSEQN